jgi:hypothetical protein
MITGNGANNFILGKINTTISNFTDSFQLNIAHVYAKADAFKSPKPYKLSPERHWLVSGNIPANTTIKGQFKYNGRVISFGGDNYLDTELIDDSEDSLFIMYRKNAGDEWSIVSDTIWSRGNKIDKTGSVSITNLKVGEYCFAMKDALSGISTTQKSIEYISIYPNPSTDTFNIQAREKGVVRVYDVQGKWVLEQQINAGLNKLNLPNNVTGVLHVQYSTTTHSESKKVVLMR